MVEGETKRVTLSSLKKGSYIVLDGAACRISGLSTSRPGKHGHAKTRITAIGLLDAKKREVVMPGHDQVDVPIIDKRTAQVLSISGDMANVLDSESYETFDIKIPSELKDKVVEGVNVLYWIILSEKIIKEVKGSE